MTLAITANAEESALAIKAAAAKLGPDVKRLMAAASVIVDSKRLTVADLDRQLAGSRLSVTERLTLKIGLTRAGLLD